MRKETKVNMVKEFKKMWLQKVGTSATSNDRTWENSCQQKIENIYKI